MQSSKRLAQFYDEIVACALVPGFGGAETPDRTRPVGITLLAGDHMNMQLPDNVAQRTDIDLVRAGDLLQGRSHHVHLEGQHRLIERRQFEYLAYAGALRHKHKPGPAAVPDQPQLAKAQSQQTVAIALQSFIQHKFTHPPSLPESPC